MSPKEQSPDPTEPRRVIAWRGVIPAFVTTTAGMLPGLLLAAMAVQIRADVGLSLTGLGLLIGVFAFFAYRHAKK